VPYRRKKLTFAISSSDEFLCKVVSCKASTSFLAAYIVGSINVRARNESQLLI